MSVDLDASVGKAFFGAFSSLRPIQESAIAPILQGKNVLVLSATGSGKTEAVTAPLVARHLDDSNQGNGTIWLYVTPTRALANDLKARLEQPLERLHVRVGIRHGDTKDTERGQKPQFLITTPESLDVMLCQAAPYLRSVRGMIVDEIHLLYNTQRGLQLSALFKRLEQHCGRHLQWCGMSATVASAEMICKFLFPATSAPVVLRDSAPRELRSHLRLALTKDSIPALFKQLVDAGANKLLVFVDSRKDCESLAALIREVQQFAHTTFCHYSSLSHEMRRATETGFWSAASAVCVATSTLELGIDIGDVDAVVLHGPPATVESFLQRVGRGNRRTGFNNVVCLTRVGSARPHLESIAFQALLQLAQTASLEPSPPTRIYGAAVQQIFSLLLSRAGAYTRVLDLVAAFDGHAHLDRESVEIILEHLVELGFLKRHGFQNRYGAAEEFYPLVDRRMVFGNFPVGREDVRVMFKTQELGTIPAFNLLRLTRNAVFRFGGRCWRVVDVGRDGIQVMPAPRHSSAIDISYLGTALGYSAQVLEQMHQILAMGDLNPELMCRKDYADVTSWLERVRPFMSGAQVPEILTPEGPVYVTLAGIYVNRAIALLSRQTHFDCNALAIRCSNPIDFRSLPRRVEDIGAAIDENFTPEIERTLFQQLLPRAMQTTETRDAVLMDPASLRIWQRLCESSVVSASELSFRELIGSWGSSAGRVNAH